MLAGCGVALLAMGAGAAVAVAQAPTLMLSVPPVVKAKKAFSWTVSGSDPNPGALLDVFVRPTITPCAPTASKEGTSVAAGGNGGQSLIAEQTVSGSFSFTRRLSPVKGPSTFCAYVHTGDPGKTPDATATAKFTAKKRGGQSGG
jgi:hypothetical protein